MRRLALTAILAIGRAAAAGEPEGIGWDDPDHLGLTMEVTAAPTGGVLLDDEEAVAGISLSAGARYVLWPRAITTEESLFLESFMGDHFGLDLNAYSLAGAGGSLWMLALHPALRNVIGDKSSTDRLQLSSLADVLLPEVGFAIRTSAADSWFLGWQVHADYLWTSRWMLSTRAGLQILHAEDSDALLTVSFGITLR